MKNKIAPIILGVATLLVVLCGCSKNDLGRTDLEYDKKGFAKTKIDFVDFTPYSNETHELNVYYKEKSFIPYVTLEDVTTSLDTMMTDGVTCKTENGRSTILLNEEEMICYDSSSNSITENDYIEFFEFKDDDEAFDFEYKLKDDAVAWTDKTSRTMSLTEYSYNMYEYNGNVLIPYFILEYTLFSGSYIMSIYNGNAIYAVYGGAYGSDEYSEMEKTKNDSYYKSKELKELTYNSLRFLYDNYYGLSLYNNLDGSVFESHEDVYLNGSSSDVWKQIVDDFNVFDDIHTSLFTCSIDNSFYNLGINYYDYSDSLEDFLEINDTLSKYAKDEYMEYGNTAYCRIDSFDISIEGSAEDESNTHKILESALKQASQNPNITNFIVDISLNTGGNTSELYRTVGLITDKELYFAEYNTAFKSEEVYGLLIDSDLDGDYTDKDSYAERFNFFIETSGSSFSCGNDFPFYCKYIADAKIIGQKSGGGICNVIYFSLPNGVMFQMSSNSVGYITTDPSYHMDKWIYMDEGCPVDIEITDYSKFYDIKYLNQLINA